MGKNKLAERTAQIIAKLLIRERDSTIIRRAEKDGR